ncbi:MAG TPA: tubulin-like doman-containing protein, partial [Egibacteraceae bacterium]|nr:tubulin-like doman-containing protein [Egibacteraceae bacterium]
SPDEYVNLGSDFDANRVVEFMQQTEGLYESIREWWTTAGHDAGRLRVKNGAGQMRDVGRLALFVGYQQLVDRLKTTLGQLQNVANLQRSQQILAPIGLKPDPSPQVWLVGSLCGGTGAGIFLDVAYMLRDLLQSRSTFLPNGIFVLPQAFMPSLVGKVDLQRRIQANSYAALLELAELMNVAERSKFEFYPDQQNRVALESAFARRSPVAVGEGAGQGLVESRHRPPEEYTRAGGAGYGGPAEPHANGHTAAADRPRLRPPSVPFDRIFLVDQENEGSISWSTMGSVTDMVAQALLVNIVYRQQIEWEERNIYFTETYPGIPNGWRHFNSLGASSLVLLHGEEQDLYTLAVQRRLCDVLLDGSGAANGGVEASSVAAAASGRVDEVLELCRAEAILRGLRPAGLVHGMRGARPTANARVEWETAARYHEYLRSELRVVRQDELTRLEEGQPTAGAALRERIESAIEQRCWEICRARGLRAAESWVASLATEIDRASMELQQSGADDGANARAAERERTLSDDALEQIEERRGVLQRLDGIRGSLFEHPARAATWIWARMRGRGTDLDRLYEEADRRMTIEFDAHVERVCAQEGARVLAGLLGARGQQRDRAVVSRLERQLQARRADVEALATQLESEIAAASRRLAAESGDPVIDGRVVSDLRDAGDELAREQVVKDLCELLRTEFMPELRARLLEAFGPSYAWQVEDLRQKVAEQAVSVYVRWLSETTEQYAADGIKADVTQLKMKLAQSRALVNYTREVRAEDLCPHLRRVFVADSRSFWSRYGGAMAEEKFHAADCYATRNPLRVDVYQAVYGLPASLLTHIEEYGRVYEELFTKAEQGQACPLHIHRDWNRRETRPAAGTLA